MGMGRRGDAVDPCGSHDDAWRVREMATRVVIRHGVHEALPLVNRLRTDPNARVRKAAERAVAQLSAGDSAWLARLWQRDPPPVVSGWRRRSFARRHFRSPGVLPIG